MKTLFSLMAFLSMSASFAAAANPFGVFDFDLRGKTPAEQIHSIDGIGFDGITMWINNAADLAKLEAYQKAKPDLKLIAALVGPTVGKPESFDRAHMRQLARKVASMQGKIWLIVQGPKDQPEKTLTLITEVAQIAAAEKCGVSLYPHDHTAVETAEEMLVYLKKAKQPNLSISLHQCHELRAGNQARLDEVMAAVGPHVDIVTLCGSHTKLNDNSEDWSDAIKPLGEGDYDPKEFLRVLKKHKFSGTIVLHTFGLAKKPASHYQKSFDLYQKMRAEVAAEPE
jgi:sugar phosphate isomerase/epimerase